MSRRPSAASRAPARRRPVSGSRTSPTALTTMMRAHDHPRRSTTAQPRPPRIARSMRWSLPTVAPVPAPTLPSADGRRPRARAAAWPMRRSGARGDRPRPGRRRWRRPRAAPRSCRAGKADAALLEVLASRPRSPRGRRRCRPPARRRRRGRRGGAGRGSRARGRRAAQPRISTPPTAGASGRIDGAAGEAGRRRWRGRRAGRGSCARGPGRGSRRPAARDRGRPRPPPRAPRTARARANGMRSPAARRPRRRRRRPAAMRGGLRAAPSRRRPAPSPRAGAPSARRAAGGNASPTAPSTMDASRSALIWSDTTSRLSCSSSSATASSRMAAGSTNQPPSSGQVEQGGRPLGELGVGDRGAAASASGIGRGSPSETPRASARTRPAAPCPAAACSARASATSAARARAPLPPTAASGSRAARASSASSRLRVIGAARRLHDARLVVQDQRAEPQAAAEPALEEDPRRARAAAVDAGEPGAPARSGSRRISGPASGRGWGRPPRAARRPAWPSR